MNLRAARRGQKKRRLIMGRAFKGNITSASRMLLSALCLSVAVMSGCSTRVGDFSLLSTGAPQYDTMDEAPIIQTVEASDGRFWILFIPFDSPPNMKEAVDRCLDKGKGDFMERARIFNTGWTFFGLFSYDAYKVIGDVGNSKFAQQKTE